MPFSLQATANTLEQELRGRRPALKIPASWSSEFVFPAYDGLSLLNVPHTVADLLNALLPGSAPFDSRVWGDAQPTQQIDRVVAFLLDGMGYLHLQMLCQEDAELNTIVSDLTDGRGIVPLTSVMPSTTAVALTTLWTGAAPGVTGMIGSLMYLRELYTIGDMLKFIPATGKHEPDDFARWGLPPETFVPVPGVSEHLAANGVATHMILHYQLMGTGLSRILHRGIQHSHVHMGYSDMLPRIQDTLRLTRGTRSYVGIYHPGMDTIAHAYGAHNRYTHTEIKTILDGMRNVLNDPTVQDGRTVFMLLADHGHYDAPYVLDMATDTRLASLRDTLQIGLTGDERLAYVHTRAGELDNAKRIIEREHGDWLTYITHEDAIASGMFGTGALHPALTSRMGDLILTPRLNYKVTDTSVVTNRLVSVHAGLDAWEMLIPLLWKVI